MLKASSAVALGERGLEVRGVGLGGLRVAHRDRAVAAGGFAPRTARIAEHATRQFGKRDEVLIS